MIEDKWKSKASSSNLFKVSILTWIALLVLTGGYFRVRAEEGVLEVDWLVAAQIMTGILALFCGTLLVIRRPLLGFGSKILIGCISISFISSLFSKHPQVVIGYSILLAGAGVLSIGLVQRVRDSEGLEQLETVWLITMTTLLCKDATLAYFSESGLLYGNETWRLGMGVTHANIMSLSAVLAFWLSLSPNGRLPSIVRWLMRVLYIFIIILSRSRVSMASFLIGGLVYTWNSTRFKRGRSNLRPAIFCFSVMIITLGLFLLLLDLESVTNLFNYINRNQDTHEILTLTGRLEIWTHAFKIMSDDPMSMIFGHGYGASRFALNQPGLQDYYVDHCHNYYLESFFSMGAMGFTLFLSAILYSCKWIIGFSRKIEHFSEAFAKHAATVVSIILVQSITECFIVTKVNQITLIAFLYLISLDTSYFHGCRKPTSNQKEHSQLPLKSL